MTPQARVLRPKLAWDPGAVTGAQEAAGTQISRPDTNPSPEGLPKKLSRNSCDGGVQVVDDDGDVVHPLNGHVCQPTAAASRQPGVEGTDGSPGLKVMPFDGLTMSDRYDPREFPAEQLLPVQFG